MDAVKEGSKWIDYIKIAVANLNDKKIHTHFMPYIKAKAHPSIKDQEKMANSLIDFIDKNIDTNTLKRTNNIVLCYNLIIIIFKFYQNCIIISIN